MGTYVAGTVRRPAGLQGDWAELVAQEVASAIGGRAQPRESSHWGLYWTMDAGSLVTGLYSDDPEDVDQPFLSFDLVDVIWFSMEGVESSPEWRAAAQVLSRWGGETVVTKRWE